MQTEESRIVFHGPLVGDYRLMVLDAPETARTAAPGQFVHLRVPGLEETALRRPLSIHRAAEGRIHLLYKVVGRGTRALSEACAGAAVNVLGPLGRGFPLDIGDRVPLLVGGGFGVAPLLFLAERLPRAGVLFAGGRTAGDILLRDEFEALGWELRLATNDGSLGVEGFVTDAMDAWAAETGKAAASELFACGPNGMLRAVGDRAGAWGCDAWLSLDERMVCGVGACLACVQKIRGADGGVRWGRVCKDGPVFESREIVWEA